MIARAPSTPASKPTSLTTSSPPVCRPSFFFILYFKGTKTEKGETNSSKAATPLTNTQALQWGSRGVATTTHREVRGAYGDTEA